jgi:hypothetical protein
MLQPQPNIEEPTSTPNMDTLPKQTPMGAGMTPEEGMPEEGEDTSIVQNLEAHLDQLPEQDKAFLGEHLTPEFVRAIGLINGPEVAQYLSQFMDPDKVLVPVPRKVAEEYMKAESGQQPPSAPQSQPMPQGQPMPAPKSAPMAPPQGMMTPQM